MRTAIDAPLVLLAALSLQKTPWKTPQIPSPEAAPKASPAYPGLSVGRENCPNQKRPVVGGAPLTPLELGCPLFHARRNTLYSVLARAYPAHLFVDVVVRRRLTKRHLANERLFHNLKRQWRV